MGEGEEREERETEKRIAQGTQAQSMKMATDSGWPGSCHFTFLCSKHGMSVYGQRMGTQSNHLNVALWRKNWVNLHLPKRFQELSHLAFGNWKPKGPRTGRHLVKKKKKRLFTISSHLALIEQYYRARYVLRPALAQWSSNTLNQKWINQQQTHSIL